MKINGEHIPDRPTHEEAADLFMSTATGRSAGVTREQVLVLLRARFPTEDALAAFFSAAKSMLAGALQGATIPARRYFEYTLGPNNASITCNSCGKTSHHPEDVRHRFCGHCKKFHER